MVVQASGATSNISGVNFDDEDQLYQIAQMAGGQIAENANEISHPTTGILSTIGSGFKTAFKTFIDTISIPSEIVAGAISDKYTIGEAIDKHKSIDDAIFGDTNLFGPDNENQTTMQKTGGFIVRAAADILFDPLTYLTFGANIGTKVKILNEAGLAAKSTISAEFASKTFETETLKKAINFVGREKGLNQKELVTFEDNAINSIDTLDSDIKTVYERYRMDSLEDSSGTTFQEIKTLNKEGKKFLTKSAQLKKDKSISEFYDSEAKELMIHTGDTYDDAIKRVKQMIKNEEYDISFIKETLDAPLDMAKAAETVGNIISRKPALYKELIDKGGIKYLGRTILEGQRIEKVLKSLPMAHQAENVSSFIRQEILRLKPETKGFSEIERKYADISKSKKNQAMVEVVNIFKQNKITSSEADFITSAIEYGKMPVDEKSKALFLNAHGIGYESMFNDPRLIQAIRSVKNMNEVNYRDAIAHGISLSRKDNYMSHLTPLGNIIKNNFNNISINSKLKAANGTTLLKYISEETGEELVHNGKYVGNADSMAVKLYDPSMELNVLKETVKKVEDRYNIKIDTLQDHSIEMQNKIINFFKTQTISDFREMIKKSIPDGHSDDIESAVRVFQQNIPNIDIVKLKNARISALSSAEKGIGEILKTSSSKLKEEVSKLIKQNQRISQDAPELGSNINNVLLKLTTEQLDTFHTSVVKPSTELSQTDNILASEAKEFIKNIKQLNKNYSDELLKNSIDDENLSKYLNNVLTEFESNPTGVKHLLNAMIGNDNKMAKLLIEMSDKRLELLKKIDTTGAYSLLDGKLFRSQSGEIYRAARPTILEAEANGFIFEKNALSILVRSSMDTVKATVSKNFIMDIAEKFGRLESEASGEWREVSVSGLKESPKNLSNYLTGKSGERIVFHPDIANKIEKFHQSVINDEDISAVLRNFDKLTSAFKASVTSIFPAFHGRNAISNVLNSYLDIGRAALNPANHVMSIGVIKSSSKINGLKARIASGDFSANSELYKELNKEVFKDKNGYVWTMGQIHQLLKNKNVALGNQYAGRIDVASHETLDKLGDLNIQVFGDDSANLSTKLARATTSGVGKVFKGGAKVGQTIEDHSRIIHFLEHLNNTGDVDLAAERTKMFLFDYGDLSSFERNFMKRIIPFYTWMKKNVELQVRVLGTTPGMIGQEVHMFNTLSSVMSNGNGLTDEEFNSLPDYMKDQFIITTARNGDKLHVLTNIGSPLEGALGLLNPRNVLSSVNPFIRLPVELSTGYDTFKGGMMSDTNNAKILRNAPQAIKDLVGYVSYTYVDKATGETKRKESALNTKMFYFLMNQPLGSRIFKEYLHTNDTNVDGKTFNTAENIRRITGIQSIDLDMEQFSDYAQKKRVEQLNELLSKSGIKYKIEKYYNSKTSTIVDN